MPETPPEGTREETEDERADRNWNELLQELRVSQTGVQLLAGFLVTLPFQERFEDLDAFQRGWYVGLLGLALGTVGVMLSPVAIHRRVFQEGAKPELVQAGHRMTVVALGLIGVLLGGIAFLAAASAGIAVAGLVSLIDRTSAPSPQLVPNSAEVLHE